MKRLHGAGMVPVNTFRKDAAVFAMAVATPASEIAIRIHAGYSTGEGGGSATVYKSLTSQGHTGRLWIRRFRRLRPLPNHL